jgi:hypothetical protein
MFTRMIIALTAAALAAISAPAQAQQNRPTPADVGPLAGGGGFVIQSCGETGSAMGWTVSRPNPAAIDAGIECPPVRGHVASQPSYLDQTGLWASDRLGNAGGDVSANAGDRAELTFATLPGTTISRLRYWRKISKYADDNWQPYVAVGSRAGIVDTCDVNGAVACQVGADDWYPADSNPEIDRTAYVDHSGVSASSVLIGLTCRDNDVHACGAGFSIPHVEAQVYSMFLTIADPGAPTLGTPSGPGWTATDWLQGLQTVTVATSDTTGISATRLYADSSLIAEAQRTCAYNRPRPCTDEPGATLQIPTGTLADGTHALQVATVDAAGNETRAARPEPLRVDNHAPAPPLALTADSPISSTNSFAASWALPSDAGAPIVAARYQLCQNGSCGAIQTSAQSTSAAGLSLPAAGTATLRVWLVDQLGHEDPASAAAVPLTYAPVTTDPVPGPSPAPQPQPAPQLSPAPQPTPSPQPPATLTPGHTSKADPKLRISSVRRSGRRLTVAGTIAKSASGRLRISYSVRIRGRTTRTTKASPISHHAFRASVTLSREVAAVATGRVNVTYVGDSDTKSATRTAIVRRVH